MITTRPFGTNKAGQKVTLYTISNDAASVSIMDLGATVTSFLVKDKNGETKDIVLGYEEALPYEEDHDTYFGATVGRCANRIGFGTFSIGDETYHLPINNGPHSNHGGKDGFSFRMFNIEASQNSVKATIFSPDGEEGYPGNMELSVLFTLEGSTLSIEYFAKSDKDTVANFTNHSFFNLGEANILNHTLQVFSDAYCENDETSLPTGSIFKVDDTSMDFREPTVLKTRILKDEPIFNLAGGGLDHNFVLAFERGQMKKAASLICQSTGLCLNVSTDLPGVQIYTANYANVIGKGGMKCGKHSGVAIETQGFPNAPNTKHFPSTIIKANEEFYSKSVYEITTI